MLVKKQYEKGMVYCDGTVRRDKCNMTLMSNDNEMKRSDIGFQFTENIAAVKWFDKRGVTLLGTALEGCNQVSLVSRRVKGQSTKSSVPYPQIIRHGRCRSARSKISAYKLDRKSCGGRYYLRLFFGLMDMCVVNS